MIDSFKIKKFKNITYICKAQLVSNLNNSSLGLYKVNKINIFFDFIHLIINL
jgi:hypothetical protein